MNEETDFQPWEISRREFLRLLGTGTSLIALNSCMREPEQPAVPYVRRPAEVIPGLPLTYATAMTLDGYGTGLLVRAREGRPIKVEGNPDHPASLGAAGVLEQASVLDLYDPRRARGIRRGNQPATWTEFARAFGLSRGDRGDGLHFVMAPTSSPLRISLIERVRERYPRCRISFYAPLVNAAPARAARSVLGRNLVPQYDFGRAQRVVAFGSDFLAAGPCYLRYARQFAGARSLRSPQDEMNRLYVAEAMPTPTGTFAEHRLAVRDSQLPFLLAALVAQLGGSVASELPLSELERRWLAALARDLQGHRGASVVIAGESLPPAAHALALLANDAPGNVGQTVWYTEPTIFEAGTASHTNLIPLREELAGGVVDTLVILDCNPAYDASADIDIAKLLDRAAHTVYLGPAEDETGRRCQWLIPAAHYLESWADTRAYDGTATIVQPLIAPLYDSHTPDEVLAVFAAATADSPYALVREYWIEKQKNDETWWRTTVQRGVVEKTAVPRSTPRADRGAVAALVAEMKPAAPEVLEIAFRAGTKVYDGRFAGNAWLLELPEPITKLTWSNAALLSPQTARRLDINSEDVISVRIDDRVIEAPALIVAGHAHESITLQLGYGRAAPAGIGGTVGFSAYRVRTSAQPFLATGTVDIVTHDLTIRRVRKRHPLGITQLHAMTNDRPVALAITLEAYRADPDFTREYRGPLPSLYEGPPLDAPEQWAMTIDLAACTGCSACVVACQAENNIPVVGETEVRKGRIMHWLRIDQYTVGEGSAAHVVHQPMLCQHCEQAPCEYVCPVNATVHSPDGLNEMIYNRCVGTRFCSNNCPYKVRRFNWFDYNGSENATKALVHNPEVTVRDRGVMEKCTYCVQRIRNAEIQARNENRRLRDGEIVTACQQACPSGAIVFGSLTHPDSAVAHLRQDLRRYNCLHDLGTRPRTQYLTCLTNPNAELQEG